MRPHPIKPLSQDPKSLLLIHPYKFRSMDYPHFQILLVLKFRYSRTVAVANYHKLSMERGQILLMHFGDDGILQSHQISYFMCLIGEERI